MTCKRAIEEQIATLRAEYQTAKSNRIFEELWLCELMLVGLEWRAEREAREG